MTPGTKSRWPTTNWLWRLLKMTKKPGDSPSNPPRPLSIGNRLPGAGVRRDLKETWGNIKSKTDGEQAESSNAEARLLKITRLSPNPNQPRRTLDAGRDEELAADVKERG